MRVRATPGSSLYRHPITAAPRRERDWQKYRGCLQHDDRVDALAGAVSHLQRVLAQDVDEAVAAQREAEKDAEVEAFLAMHEHVQSRDGRVFVVGADEYGYDDEYEVLSYTVH
jgi:hypothetical protein